MAFKMKGFSAGKGTGSSGAFPKSSPKKQNPSNYTDAIVGGTIEQRQNVKKYYEPDLEYHGGTGQSGTDRKAIVNNENLEQLFSAARDIEDPKQREEFMRNLSRWSEGMGEASTLTHHQQGWRGEGDTFQEDLESGEKKTKGRGTVTYNRRFLNDPRFASNVKDLPHKGGSYSKGFDDFVWNTLQKADVPRIPRRGPEKVTPTGKKDDLRLPERGDGLTGSANIDMQIMDRINKPKGDISFGDAFKRARSGEDHGGTPQATFEWKGKKYHTRRADESKADWQKKFKTDKPSPGKEPKVIEKKTKKKKIDKKEKKGKKDKDDNGINIIGKKV